MNVFQQVTPRPCVLAFQNFTVHLGSEAALFPIIFLQPHITTGDRQFPPVPPGPALPSLEQFPPGMLLGKRQEHG